MYAVIISDSGSYDAPDVFLFDSETSAESYSESRNGEYGVDVPWVVKVNDMRTPKTWDAGGEG